MVTRPDDGTDRSHVGCMSEPTPPSRSTRRTSTARGCGSPEVDLPQPVFTWLAVHGQPIRYGYVDRPWPISTYQNVYATEPGSAEMPSAGRPFTPEIITRLVAKGVGVSPLVLHTGVASLEATELPYPERLRVPASTADRVNDTHRNGGRVIAVGTTVVRGLETAGRNDGLVQPIDGWTDLVITPERGVHVVDGLLTGWHEPEASHLLMLEAVAGRSLLEISYAASLRGGLPLARVRRHAPDPAVTNGSCVLDCSAYRPTARASWALFIFDRPLMPRSFASL